MPAESVLLPLGLSLARLLLDTSTGSDLGKLVGDAKDSWTALDKFRRRDRGAVDAIGQAIAKTLAAQLGGKFDQDRQDVRAVADDVAGYFDRARMDLAAVRSAAASPETFGKYVWDHGGTKLLKQTSSAASPAFVAMLTVAAEEFTRLAPFSPQFQPAACQQLVRDSREILARLDRIQDDVSDIKHAVMAREQRPDGLIAVGAIPGRPPANVERAELEQLREALQVRGRAAVCAGGRGVGKSQLAAAYARDRIEAGCPLVVWANAETLDDLVRKWKVTTRGPRCELR